MKRSTFVTLSFFLLHASAFGSMGETVEVHGTIWDFDGDFVTLKQPSGYEIVVPRATLQADSIKKGAQGTAPVDTGEFFSEGGRDGKPAVNMDFSF